MVTIKAYKAGMQEAKEILQQTKGDKLEALNILYKQLKKAEKKDDYEKCDQLNHSIEALRDLILEEYAEAKGYTYDKKKFLWIRKE